MKDRERPADNGKAKRPRGRPKGSGPYREGDLAVLSSFADHEIETPNARLAPYLTKRSYSSEAVRRVQALWRTSRDELRAAAKLRFDSRPPESLAQVLFNLVAGLKHLGKAVLDSEFGQILNAGMTRARARQKALEALDRASDLPFDITNTSAFDAAIARAEREMHLLDSPEIKARLSDRTLADLSLSERAYVMAIQLHAFSLHQYELEIEAAETGTPADLNQDKRGLR